MEGRPPLRFSQCRAAPPVTVYSGGGGSAEKRPACSRLAKTKTKKRKKKKKKKKKMKKGKGKERKRKKEKAKREKRDQGNQPKRKPPISAKIIVHYDQ